MNDIRDDSPLHALWSKAVGTADYDKSEWLALEGKLSMRKADTNDRLRDFAERCLRNCGSVGERDKDGHWITETEALLNIEKMARSILRNVK